MVLELGLTSLAVPALGCGNGGLSWSMVRPLIEETFQAAPDVRVVLFPPPARQTRPLPRRNCTSGLSRHSDVGQ